MARLVLSPFIAKRLVASALVAIALGGVVVLSHRNDLNEVEAVRLEEACEHLQLAMNMGTSESWRRESAAFSRLWREIEDHRGRFIPARYKCGE